MNRRRRLRVLRVGLRPMRFFLVFLAACESGSPVPLPMQATSDAADDSSTPIDAGAPKPRPLGLNDVTILIPLAWDPSDMTLLRASDEASDGTPFVTRAMYDRLNNVPKRGPVVFLDDLYPLLQVVAVRFDLCDRIVPGPCADEDGRMRLVLQPQYPKMAVGVIDLGLHAFYTIPKSDFPALVKELRAMAAIQDVPITTPLQPNPALMKSTTGEYAMRLKALVVKYGVHASLTRLTFLAARDAVASASWTFRGVERNGAGFVDIQIPDIASTLQDATLGGTMASFKVVPGTDTPSGFALATDEIAFAKATPQDQRAALSALNAIDNPLMSTPNTVACVTCHISGQVVGPRGQVAMADARTLPNRYTSGTFDLSVPNAQTGSLRSLGWANRARLVSQRVANESAQTASEMNARFPP